MPVPAPAAAAAAATQPETGPASTARSTHRAHLPFRPIIGSSPLGTCEIAWPGLPVQRSGESHHLQQPAEARIAAHLVEQRLHLEVAEPAPALFTRALEPGEGLVGLAEAQVHGHEGDRRHVALL